MHTDWDHAVSRNGVSKSFAATAIAAVLASASLVVMPTPASAFNLNGLIQVAIAQYAAGGYRVPAGGYYGRDHEATQHSHHSDDDEDAAPGSSNTPPPPKDAGAPPRRLSDGGREVTQQAMNTRVVTTGRPYAEEPAFGPSR
jgi:hypothetical protein